MSLDPSSTDILSAVCPRCLEPFDARRASFACPHPLLGSVSEEQEEVHADPLIGQEFDQLKVLELLGYGGTSKVYKVSQDHGYAAMKVLHLHLCNDSSVQRFQVEAEAAAKLIHSGIARVFTLGLVPDGRPYILLEFLEGESLDALLLKGGRLMVVKAVRIVTQACDALAHAHEKGIIHRDIKPSNIFLTKSQEVKILDFGLAKIKTPDNAAFGKMSKAGQTFGTPDYMSPEQCLGKPLTPASDIYSLGCVLYELLCGQKVVHGESFFEAMNQHVSVKPKRFDEKLGIPPPVEKAVLKALEKNDRHRYRTMTELGDALRKTREVGVTTGRLTAINTDRPEKSDQSDRSDKANRFEKAARSENQFEKPAKPAKSEKPAKPEKPAKLAKPDKPPKPDKPKNDKPVRSLKPESNNSLVIKITAVVALCTGIAAFAFGYWQTQNNNAVSASLGPVAPAAPAKQAATADPDDLPLSAPEASGGENSPVAAQDSPPLPNRISDVPRTASGAVRPPLPNVKRDKRYRPLGLVAVEDTQPDRPARAAAVEKYRSQHPHFDFFVENEYRSLLDGKKALAEADYILSQAVANYFTVAEVGQWRIYNHSDDCAGIYLLKQVVAKNPDLRYLKAAALLNIADAYAGLKQFELANYYYQLLKDDHDPKILEYNKLASQRISGLEKKLRTSQPLKQLSGQQFDLSESKFLAKGRVAESSIRHADTLIKSDQLELAKNDLLVVAQSKDADLVEYKRRALLKLAETYLRIGDNHAKDEDDKSAERYYLLVLDLPTAGLDEFKKRAHDKLAILKDLHRPPPEAVSPANPKVPTARAK